MDFAVTNFRRYQLILKIQYKNGTRSPFMLYSPLIFYFNIKGCFFVVLTLAKILVKCLQQLSKSASCKKSPLAFKATLMLFFTSIYLYQSFYLFIYPSIFLFINLCIYLSIYLTIYLLNYLSIYI